MFVGEAVVGKHVLLIGRGSAGVSVKSVIIIHAPPSNFQRNERDPASDAVPGFSYYIYELNAQQLKRTHAPSSI